MEYKGENNLKIMKSATNYNNFLLELVCKNAPHNIFSVLDFGAGEGTFATLVEKQINTPVYSLEPAENMQKYYTTSPLQNLSELGEKKVDYIYSLNVLEHIENDKEIVDDFYNALAPGGVVFLYLPAFPCLYSSVDKQVGHYRRYTKKDILRLIDTRKWIISEIKYVDFLGWFLGFVFKCIEKKEGIIPTDKLKIYDKYFFPISAFLDKITFGKILGKNIAVRFSKNTDTTSASESD